MIYKLASVPTGQIARPPLGMIAAPRVRFRLPRGRFCEEGLLLVLLARPALLLTFAATARDNIWLAGISPKSINITPISTCFTKNARPRARSRSDSLTRLENSVRDPFFLYLHRPSTIHRRPPVKGEESRLDTLI